MQGIVKRIIIQIPEDVLEELDKAAEEHEVSRASFARTAIEIALAERRRNMEIAAVIRSFEQKPQEENLFVSKAATRKVWPS